MPEDRNLSPIYEKLGALEQKVSSAHHRTDRLEEMMKEYLSEIKADVKQLMTESHERKGFKAATFLFGSLIGGLVSAFTSVFLHK